MTMEDDRGSEEGGHDLLLLLWWEGVSETVWEYWFSVLTGIISWNSIQ